jgi:hypothetical protein
MRVNQRRKNWTVKRLVVGQFIKSPVFLVGLVTLMGILLRLRGVTRGLPYLYDPDEHFIVDPALGFVVSGDLNPHSFFYPGSTIMYPLGLVYFAYWMLGYFVGWFTDLQSFGTFFWTNPKSFYLIARVLCIVLSSVAIPLTYAVGRTVAGKGAALAAAIFVAASPLHVDFSRLVRTDPVMTTFVLAAMLYAVRAMGEQFDRQIFISGIFIGLATATKFTGVSGAMIVVLAVVLAKPQPLVPWMRRGQWLGLAALGASVGFFVAAPFVVTAIRNVYWILVVEGGHAHLSASGGRGLPNYLWYLGGPLRSAVGWPLELLALIGIASSCGLRRRPRLLLASFSLLFLLGIGLSLKRWERWIVPLVPFVAILAAMGLETIVRPLAWFKLRPIGRDLAVVALGLALVAPVATEAYQRGEMGPDTRDIAKAWVERHVPRGTRVAVEQYAPPISRNEYQVFFVGPGGLTRDTTTRGFKGVLGDLKTLEPLRENAIEFALLSDYSDRYQAEEQSYPNEVRLYRELYGASVVVYELRPIGRSTGPVVRVLKLRR